MSLDDEELKKKVHANEVGINAGYKELTNILQYTCCSRIWTYD